MTTIGESCEDDSIVGEIIRQVELAFRNVPAPTRICACSDERVSLEPPLARFVANFENRDWRNITLDTAEEFAEQLPLLTAGALHFFLPAFLRFAAKLINAGNIESNVVEFLLFALDSAASSKDRNLIDRLSVDQRKAVRSVLTVIEKRANDIEWRERASRVGPAFWENGT